MADSNIVDFATSSATSVNSTPSLVYSLPAFLNPSFQTSFSTNLSTAFTHYPLYGSINVTAGLSGGIDLTFGNYSLDYKINVNPGLPTGPVLDGSVFSVDPTLVGTDDAMFSLTGPGASVNLDLGISGGAMVVFNPGSSIGASFSLGPSFGYSYSLPTSHTFTIPGVNGVSLTLAAPVSFNATGTAGANSGSLAALSASGSDNAFLSGTIDAVGLLTNLSPVLSALIDGGVGVSGATLGYDLLSTPLTASLKLAESVTITPLASIGVTLSEVVNNIVFATDQGTLGQTFSFVAPPDGAGDMKIEATYTLGYQVSVGTSIVGDLKFSIDGPQVSGSLAGAGFTLGPAFEHQFFDMTTGLGTLATSTMDSSLTATESYDIAYNSVVCFAAGTLIATARGDVAVEDLRVGETVVTASGALRPIQWLGHRRVDCRRHSPAVEAMPVRIAAHAFGPERPARDLLVSPGHAICVDLLGEIFIPAHALVNGSTIVQLDVGEIVYWHVELDSHDIVLAENLPCESYVEHGNRSFFVETDVTTLSLRPDATPDAQAKLPFCRPFHESGVLVDAARAQLRRRAEALGWRLEPASLADLYVIAAGRRIEPRIDGLSLSFALPPGAGELWLIAPTARPFDIADSLDKRELGIRISRLGVDGVDVALDDARLDVGFHAMERDWRWTSGRTKLPASLFSGAVKLELSLCAPPLPRWSPPASKIAPVALSA